MCQSPEGTHELWYRPSFSENHIPAKVQMLEMGQSEQRRTYLAMQRMVTREPKRTVILFDEFVVEVELDDVACPAVAPHAAPLAAVVAMP